MRRLMVYWLIFLLSIASFAFADSVKKKKTTQKSEHVKSQCLVHSEEKPEHPWQGSKVQLGLALTTGNTNTTDINAAAELNYTHGRWNNLAQGSAQLGKDKGTVNKEKYTLQDQLSYSLNNIKEIDNYLFANAFLNIDYFSPFDYQSVYTAGYGRDWIKNDHFTFSTQVGPGFRHDKQRSNNQANSSFVLSLKSNIIFVISSSTTLSERLRYDIGDPFGSFNYLQSVTTLTNHIIHNLSVEIACNIDHYSKIPPGSSNTDKTDTTTNVALVYNF